MTQQIRVAIVTGAGTGIGKAAALALLKDGYRVALAGRRKELLDRRLAEAGGRHAQRAGRADRRRPSRSRCAALFAQTKRDLRPARRAVQQRRHGRARACRSRT